MGQLHDLASFIMEQPGFDPDTFDFDTLVESLEDSHVASLFAEDEEEIRKWTNSRYNLFFPDETLIPTIADVPIFYARDLYPRHMEFFRAGQNWTERLFQAGNRVGKAQPNDEPVLTPNGWRRMGDIKVGDCVIGSQGHAVAVVGTYPQGVRRIVTVRGSDGSSTRCDLDHLWTVRPVKDGRASKHITITAADLQQRIARGERWMLPQRPVVEFASGPELVVDPYLIGLLLGDDGLSTRSILLSTEDAEIVEYAREQASEWNCSLRQAGPCTWHFSTNVRRGGRHHNFLREALLSLGMIGCNSHTKRIPPDYMFASSNDRIALLQGLMDTDGSCSKASGARQFYSVNRALCEDVAALARSLGMNASIRPKNGQYKGRPHSSWLVNIASSPVSVFRLARKRANERFSDVRQRGIIITSIEEAGEAGCTCIAVDADDSLYVTRDFIVTHNTITGAFEVTAHTTGQYKDWWEGRRFSHPTHGWAAGDTNETTRDIIQKELFGQVTWEDGRKTFDGSGMIPKEAIGPCSWKRGVDGLADVVKVKHISGGWSTIGLKSYEQGRKIFQGTAKHWIWFDEEPPADVYGEALIRLMTTKGLMLITFTPLSGISEVVLSFMPDMDVAPLRS